MESCPACQSANGLNQGPVIDPLTLYPPRCPTRLFCSITHTILTAATAALHSFRLTRGRLTHTLSCTPCFFSGQHCHNTGQGLKPDVLQRSSNDTGLGSPGNWSFQGPLPLNVCSPCHITRALLSKLRSHARPCSGVPQGRSERKKPRVDFSLLFSEVTEDVVSVVYNVLLFPQSEEKVVPHLLLHRCLFCCMWFSRDSVHVGSQGFPKTAAVSTERPTSVG